jgi:hypothetical protein
VQGKKKQGMWDRRSACTLTYYTPYSAFNELSGSDLNTILEIHHKCSLCCQERDMNIDSILEEGSIMKVCLRNNQIPFLETSH